MQWTPFIRLARPSHWVKNSIVLLPVVFGRQMDRPKAWLLAGLAAAAFCLASSAAYAVNDILDRDRDRLHPDKRNRPVAAGELSLRQALAAAGVLLAAAVMVISWTGAGATACLVAYVLLQGAYSALLRRKMIVDVLCIAVGFVFRAVAGACAIGVAASPWLLICTLTLCLFMGFCKRYTEVAVLNGNGAGRGHRLTLAGYSTDLLTHLITLSAGIAIVSFLQYTMSVETVARFGTHYLVFTLPAVIYGVCRFAMLSMAAAYPGPTELILRDRPFQAAVLSWVLAAAVIVRWGRDIGDCLAASGT